MGSGPSEPIEAPVLKILASRFLTRSGDQAWDFAVPITLVYIYPKNLALVALLYLCSKLVTMILQPWVASVIDRWKRLNAAFLGTGLQVTGMFVVVLSVLLLLQQSVPDVLPIESFDINFLFAGVVVGTVLSNLGSSLMDIAVGSDWVPAVIPEDQLGRVNSRLRQIDLATEVGSPVIAGAMLAVSSASGPLLGFLGIALWNVISFVPEIFFLRNVFLNSPKLQRAVTRVSEARRASVIGNIIQGWRDFRVQPSYLAMVAYAALWLSALSPHGVLLTGFLKGTWALSEFSLGVFRGLGALFGLGATLLFPVVRQKLGLVQGSLFFILFQAGLLLLSIPFFVTKAGQGWVFLGFVLVSRVGLYGFSLGETELRQRTIPEGYRGRVNGVATSLTSLATLVLFGIGTLLPHAENFIILVLVSVGAVCVGAAVFAQWSRRDSARALS